MVIKALITGVSNYNMEGAPDLPFCKNDLAAMENSLSVGLKLDRTDIIKCGESGNLTVEEFNKELSKLSSTLNKNDTLLFYFSGHGHNIDQQHYLVLSDDFISTNELIRKLEKIQAKSKVIFLDCCFSGNFTVGNTSETDFEKMMSDFYGRGYAVLASSSANQVSYRHPSKPMSLFTSFLCDAIKNKSLVKKGKVTLNDIQKLTSLYLDVWNKKNPQFSQKPIFKKNMGGTIFFEVDEYTPYPKSCIYYESEQFSIYDVEPLHTGKLKRYAVKVTLNEPLSLEEISNVSNMVKNIIKSAEVYNNKISEERWKGKPTNIIWIYYGFDESDMNRGNFICHTTWCDEYQDKERIYSVDNKNTLFINNTHFTLHTFYKSLKEFQQANTGSQNELIVEFGMIAKAMIESAELIIDFYHEHTNGLYSEKELARLIATYIAKIEELYLASSDLPLAPYDLQQWVDSYHGLFSSIHNLTYYYNERYLSQRSPENRKIGMEMSINQYYEELESIREIERSL
ncbi:caspase family protein [Bhargavaea massiliensis]|uniref:caspase family protein n=1 Tax=Bhargavaea massiliensis TaxID=2697500 RepID=UPI001F1A3D6E|nr:caspase family protein [Bhargavaea massiliensis]